MIAGVSSLLPLLLTKFCRYGTDSDGTDFWLMRNSWGTYVNETAFGSFFAANSATPLLTLLRAATGARTVGPASNVVSTRWVWKQTPVIGQFPLEPRITSVYSALSPQRLLFYNSVNPRMPCFISSMHRSPPNCILTFLVLQANWH